MQGKIKCCLVKDMLPLYVDGIVSEKTKKEIACHIDECDECRQLENDMRADVISVEIEGLSDDIDGFKKINNKNKKKIALSILTGICMTMFIAVFILFNTFIKGKEIESTNLKVGQLLVENNTLSLEIDSKDSACGITNVLVKENDGVVTLHVRGAHKSRFSKSTVSINEKFKNTIKTVIVADEVEYEDGYVIDEETRQIYINKQKNMNDVNKLKNLIKAINVKASYFKTDLVKVSDVNKVVLKASEFGNMTTDNVEFYAEWFSYYMFACVDDLETIEWEYEMDDINKVYTLHISDAEQLLGVESLKSFGETLSKMAELEYLILVGDIDAENERYGFEEEEDGYAEAYQFAVNKMLVNNNVLYIKGEHLYAEYKLGDIEVTEENGVVNIEAKIIKVENFDGLGTPFVIKETFKNNITSVYLAEDIIYDDGVYIESDAAGMYKYKLESVSEVDKVQKLVYGVTVGQRDAFSIYNVDVKGKDIQVRVMNSKDDVEIIKMEKSTPLILALAKDAESVTWFDKNGNLIHKLTLQEIGQSIKEAGESAGALQKYINDENIGHYLSY